jgi:hypothetical protein
MAVRRQKAHQFRLARNAVLAQEVKDDLPASVLLGIDGRHRGGRDRVLENAHY